MQMDSLDVLAEVLSRFGSQVTSEEQSRVQQVLMPLLDHPRAAVRKRTTVAIGYSVVHLTEDMYSTLMERLLRGLESTKSSEKLRTLIQCAGVLRLVDGSSNLLYGDTDCFMSTVVTARSI